MARLPGETWLIQQIGGRVILFHRHTEEEIVNFDPADVDDMMHSQEIIAKCEQLTVEQKSMAHFWSGYFYASTR